MTAIKFTADCHIKATADKPATVSILAYSGGPMRLPGLGQTVVDLAGMQLAQIPLLSDHQNSLGSIAGTGTPRIEAGKLLVEGTLARGTAAADQVIALHRSGVPLQASIGAEIGASRFVPSGKAITANGRTFTAGADGITFVSKSELREVSFVAAGADSQTSVSIAASRRKNMADFTTWGREMLGAAFDQMDSDQIAALHANYMGRSGNDPLPEDYAATATSLQATNDLASDEERRLRRLEREVLRKERLEALEAKIPLAHAPSAGRGHPTNDVLVASFCLQAGIREPEKHFPEPVLNAADSQRHVGLQGLLMQAAVAGGYQPSLGEHVSQGNIRPILTAAFQPTMQASGFSTVNIGNVLSNVANKVLLDGFTEMDDAWRSISRIVSVNDFKEHSLVRLLDSLEYEQVGPAGEIKHGTLGDDKMAVKAATYAKMLQITRPDIINDDLSALTDVPRRLGRAAAQKLNSVFWGAFNASDSFFAGGNGNVVGTGDERLSEAGLENALKAFRAQKSPAADGSKLIGGKPHVLLVPPALEIAARRLLNSSNIITGADATMPSGNPFQGLCTLVVEDRLSTAEGGNDIYWYLFRAPSFAPAMLVAALNGRVEPVVETADADFNTLGIQMRGYNDVGFGRGEKLCGLLLDGSST